MRIVSDRDQFLGYAYVNPRTLIGARIVGRDAAYPLGKSLLVHRLHVALSLRRRLYERRLPPGVRRIRRAAGAGARSLRRHRRGAERHRGHGPAASGDRSGACEKVIAACRHCVEERLRRARARRPAGVRGVRVRRRARAGRTVVEQGYRFPRRWRRARRPAGSTTRPPIASVAASTCAGARVLDVCSYVGAWAVTARCGRGHRCHLRRFVGTRRSSGCRRTRRANGVKSRRAQDDAFDALEALQRQRRASTS